MKFSVALTLLQPAQILPLAAAAERCGFDAVAVPDSVFYPERVSAPYPYTADGSRFWSAETPWIEPWVAIPAMAAVTSRLFFYTNVLKLAIRQPLLVAKTVGSAAVLSGNRVGLGVGLGWIPEEFRFCGEDYTTRGPRADEAIEVIRAVLRGGMVEHHGAYYEFERLAMSPAPSEPVPIYVGGLSKAALRRAARLGDGWISVMNRESELRGFIAELSRLRREAGRDKEPFEIKVVCTDVFDLDGYRRLEEAGVTDLISMPWYLYGGDPDPLERKERAMERFAETVIGKLR
ncbi:MAG TPA: TIGR03619 family F420-dependent LLM class oxidoreductase [Myxococcota bacterium]|nr:TIGR03619 family F420-dependent LLM class oxidoreductase [Myxococcota bacterium]